jgi:hypothetical protein
MLLVGQAILSPAWRCVSVGSPSRNSLELRLSTAKRGQSFACFLRNQRFQSGANQGGLLLDPREFLGPLEQILIDDQGGSRMH